MNDKNITQITLKSGEYIKKYSDRQNQTPYQMVGRKRWVNMAPKTKQPDWKEEGIDFIEVFAGLSKREQKVIILMKRNYRWDAETHSYDYIVELALDSVEFETAELLPYDSFLKGYKALFKKDLMRRVSKGKYMLNPEFLLPSTNSEYYKMKWGECPRHKDAPQTNIFSKDN